MGRPGRKPRAEEVALRARIENLYLTGLRAQAIRDALASPQNTTPIELTTESIERHLTAIRRGWRRQLEENPDSLGVQRAELVAAVQEMLRTAAQRSARYHASNLGVGYLNAQLKAAERLAKLLGLDAPTRTEVTGKGGAPLVDEPHPLDALPPAEQAARLRAWADELEQRA